MKWHSVITLVSALFFAGCTKKEFDDSAYVLVRNTTGKGSTTPGLRAYFIDDSAQLNGMSCREILELANEAVQAKMSRGEIDFVKYECVSLREARERGFN